MPEPSRTRKTLRTKEHRALISVVVATRKELKLTQEDLAERTAKLFRLSGDRSWIAKFEAGDRRLDVVELMWLARAMKIAPETLLTRVSKWLETTPA
jgi:transcriptional regulator with XRE-family HTH domain